MPVELKTVTESENDMRLDRWFKRNYPGLPHALLEKLLRKKNIRVDNKKATANMHVFQGQVVRVPPIENKDIKAEPKSLSKNEVALMQKMILYKDKDILVLNKPAGLAVQGGSKTVRHVDGLLEAVKFDASEKPRLVHRLDKETSGILVVARTIQSAHYLTKLFQSKQIKKTYWALVRGLPSPRKGKIEAPLAQKRISQHVDKRMLDEAGAPAVSLYVVQDHLADKISWLQMSPLTGRTHQLRIHAAQVLKTPILGDKRYGSPCEFEKKLPAKMYLHARAITLPLPNKILNIEAPLPDHFKAAFDVCGFSEKNVQPLFERNQK